MCCKSKAVPQHTYGGGGGREGIAPTSLFQASVMSSKFIYNSVNFNSYKENMIE
jgi:hypothetical protein